MYKCIPLWGPPVIVVPDVGLEFFSKLLLAVYELNGMLNVAKSSYHTITTEKGGIERVNPTMTQMRTVAIKERYIR